MLAWLRPTTLVANAGWWDLGTVQGGPFMADTVVPVSGTYGPRNPILTPTGWTYSWHSGLDLAAPLGTPLLALCDAVVDINAYDPVGAGYWIRLRHIPTGTLFHYFHMEGQALPAVGTTVLAGEVIGAVGTSGRSTGPHLHLEILPGGTHVDPWPFLSDAYDIGEPIPDPTPPTAAPFVAFGYVETGPEYWQHRYTIRAQTYQSAPYLGVTYRGREGDDEVWDVELQDWQ